MPSDRLRRSPRRRCSPRRRRWAVPTRPASLSPSTTTSRDPLRPGRRPTSTCSRRRIRAAWRGARPRREPRTRADLVERCRVGKRDPQPGLDGLVVLGRVRLDPARPADRHRVVQQRHDDQRADHDHGERQDQRGAVVGVVRNLWGKSTLHHGTYVTFCTHDTASLAAIVNWIPSQGVFGMSIGVGVIAAPATLHVHPAGE